MKKKNIIILSIAAALFLIFLNFSIWPGKFELYKSAYDNAISESGHDIMSSVIENITSSEISSADAIANVDLKIAEKESIVQKNYKNNCLKDISFMVVKYDEEDSDKYIYRVVSETSYQGFSESIFKEILSNKENAFPNIVLSDELINIYEKNVKKNQNNSLVVYSGYFSKNSFYPEEVAVRTFSDEEHYKDSDKITLKIEFDTSHLEEYSSKSGDILTIFGDPTTKSFQNFNNEVRSSITDKTSFENDNVIWITQRFNDENFAVLINVPRFSLPIGIILLGILYNLAYIVVFILVLLFINKKNNKTRYQKLKAGEFSFDTDSNTENNTVQETPQLEEQVSKDIKDAGLETKENTAEQNIVEKKVDEKSEPNNLPKDESVEETTCGEENNISKEEDIKKDDSVCQEVEIVEPTDTEPVDVEPLDLNAPGDNTDTENTETNNKQIDLDELKSKLKKTIKFINKKLKKKSGNSDILSLILNKYQKTLDSCDFDFVDYTIGCSHIYIENCGEDDSNILKSLREVEEYLKNNS